MKNILLLVHDDDGQEARLQAALDLTRAVNGHLSCVDVAVLPAVTGSFYDDGGAAMLVKIENEREAGNKTKLTARLAHEDVSWDWVDVTDSLANAVLDSAPLSDLIVLYRKLDAFPYPDMRDIASRILMHAHKPVVAVPDTLPRFDFARALIAWDGQASAAATMRACVPLLALADEVEIFMAEEGSERVDPTEAAEYLSRHDIHASIRVVARGDAAPDDLIAAECARWSADYVVMGAYSHGQLMEAFGGVTKRMLDNSKVPLVLGH